MGTGPILCLLIVLQCALQLQAQFRQSCGPDDFRCYSGRCIESSRRCNRVMDCPNNEDEQNCECREDEFRCRSDGSCIEMRKRCDGYKHCNDNSDEENCACGPDYWQCDFGDCINRDKRCNGRVDCPTDRSDERNCYANGFFRCRNGKILKHSLRCNREYDCDPGDYSDEQNCPCGDNDFKCDNGYCIPASKHCDRTHDCQDGSDESDCLYGTICMAYEHKCSSGQCVQAVSWCNGTIECDDGSDERNCPCKRDEIECGDGSCINIALRCNGHVDCHPLGEDEFNCGAPSCPPTSFTCDSGSSVACATRCDGRMECDGGEDEDKCTECNHECDGKCLNDADICNGISDCTDGSDETSCSRCDGINDFRCSNGECINIASRCNGYEDCIDNSDEINCNNTLPPKDICNENQFQCQDGTCIDSQFYCDRHKDCFDNSDEDNCPCKESEWQCKSGACIPLEAHCNNQFDCTDESDEADCFVTTRLPPIILIPTTRLPILPPIYPPSTQNPILDQSTTRQDVCAPNQWRCENGPCIESNRRCDNHVDCPHDNSDELDCQFGIGDYTKLKLMQYPINQTVRNGGDVVFQCRDEGDLRVPVRWVREGGISFRPFTKNYNGRLEMSNVTASDGGVYICQAPLYLGYPGSEKRVTLIIENRSPVVRPFIQCSPTEATCSNGQCIPKSALCDGKADCDDRSDEDSCHQNGECQPNEFHCDNGKCVLMTWLCDSENDCGDNSDEKSCFDQPGQLCSAVEFACSSNDQCIPKSYHCDASFDCYDRSDENNCAPIHVLSPPSPANVRLNPGETLVLVCEAVGVPTPFISWRLNWGHVPSKCTSTSINGVGTLTCNDMQPEDSGAYSCEAMNRIGTTFAAPDSIVYVNKTDVCPTGYFNSEARSQSECIRCFCFGESTTCHSADLFTYTMPTPLGQGGTRLIGVTQTYSRDFKISTQPVTEQYYYQSMMNGATVTKLDLGSRYDVSDVQPFLTLPETYNGNQLTSYGGHIRYNLSPHSTRLTRDQTPDIIIKGKYQSLTYKFDGEIKQNTYIEARLTPGNWYKFSNGMELASREDIMMALDNIEMILLRAGINNAGVNITHFAMESAQHVNVGLGVASLVEECTCPPGYEGLSCQKCAANYVRVQTGPWLGNCVPLRTCPEGTYGDPNSGYECKPCPCPLTNRGNQFAKTCSVSSTGEVSCDCFNGYEGIRCEHCAAGYIGNPLITGDSCKPMPTDNCNPIGTNTIRGSDECICKENVQGRFCDQCKNNSFYLSDDFRQGCALCFCSGVSQECTSSTNLRRKTMTVNFNAPSIVSQVKVYSSAPSNGAGAIKYNAPVETNLQPVIQRGELNLLNVDRSRPAIYYWSLPTSFSGDKVTSYGGYLKYTINNIAPYAIRNNAADIQLISDVTFHYFGNFEPNSDGTLTASVQLLEKGWQRPDGTEVPREYFLMALSHLKTILIKATYSTYDVASISTASIETAESNSNGNGPLALHVEQCVCPVGYIGTSCENCAPGYTRSLYRGLYLKICELCDCNGHSKMCHPETGECLNCADNTEGPNCENCKPGYVMDTNGNCVFESSTSVLCDCDPRGTQRPCDSSGYCRCKQNVEGRSCDRCRPGSFGLDASHPLGCHSCYCSGATNECHEAAHYSRIALPATVFGEKNGGYILMDLQASEVINDQFVSVPNESELRYVFSTPPHTDLYWSLPGFPGNRVLSYGGTLSLTQSFETGGKREQANAVVILVGEARSISWRSPNYITSGEALSFQVPLREDGWYLLNQVTPASREDFMYILRDLKRILVKATLSPSIISTAIADVSMDSATETFTLGSAAATGIEICVCPEGYSGTSCETCKSGYYKESSGLCRICNCNGHDCQLGVNNEVECNCRPPYTGLNCSTVGLIMELHPKIQDIGDSNPFMRKVIFTCKYRAPEPLTIKFYFKGREMQPFKYYNESRLFKDGWRGEHSWQTVWDTRRQGEIYECHTITEKGFTLGVLTTSLPEKAGESKNITSLPPLPQSTVSVKIVIPNIKIQEVGSTVNFICEAQSRYTHGALPVNWTKEDGVLPLGRANVDSKTGTLVITNLQISDSGKYICQTSDGISTGQAIATLRVPGNPMTLPTAIIMPAATDYYEGDRIELQCQVSGNPAPRTTWRRANNKPLYRASRYDSYFVINSALEEDSGEYRCISSNTMGSTDTAIVLTIRPRPPRPSTERLTISTAAVNVTEGNSTRIVCTGSAEVPAGTIEWIRQDGAELLTNVQSDNGVLYIQYATPENQGLYICHSITTGIVSVPVVVTIIPISTPPPTEEAAVSASVTNINLKTGGSGSVDCIASGYPLPMIRWAKHQGELGPRINQRENSLIITNAQLEDTGYYACQGINDGVVISRSFVYVKIEKLEAPRVEIWPRGVQPVLLETQFNFTCRMLAGDPEPVVTWERSGGRSLGPRTHLLPKHILNFESVDVNDEGEYICTASNEAGSDSSSAKIMVQSPPEIIIKPTNYVETVRGNAVHIQCRAQGYPEPMVSIKKSPDFRQIVAPSPGIAELIFPSVSESDEGNYVCVATSPAGTIDAQIAIHVDRGDGGFGDYEEGSGDADLNVDDIRNPFDEGPTRTAIEGKEARLSCNASSDFEVIWTLEDGRPMSYNVNQRGSELIIRNASKADSGEYVCQLRNRRTGEVQNAVSVELIVIAPPQITLSPPKQNVQPGESPTVECVVTGDSIRSIKWVPVNRQPSRRVEIRGSTLIFHEIKVEDAGLYECTATNPIANASAVAEVIVSEESEGGIAESHDNEQTAQVGAAVHLSCNVTEDNLRIKWHKDGKALPRSARQNNDGSLLIRLAQKSDSGRYTCVIYDQYGRQTSNYINLHIEGNECLKSQFRCHDDSGCIEEMLLCDGFVDCQDSSDEESCLSNDDRHPETPSDTYKNSAGPRNANLVAIEQPKSQYTVGENVEVMCRTQSKQVTVEWQRVGTNEYVDVRRYGDEGAVLLVQGVQEPDAGVYRCIGRDPYGSYFYEDFNLIVVPGFSNELYPTPTQPQAYMARLKESVRLPCTHNLEEPVSIEWSKEFSRLPPYARTNDPVLDLESVSETDAGTYICRVSNSRATVETRATLRVTGIVPRFTGDSWLSLPNIKDAHMHLEIEISFKPIDDNGLILYNGQNEDGSGDYVALQLIRGVPTFVIETGSGPKTVTGDRPLQLNTWHTIRLGWTKSKVTMVVDNKGPFITEMNSQWVVLELNQPLYIGSVPELNRLPGELAGASGFVGCVSMLILGTDEINMMAYNTGQYNIIECDSCVPNLCLHGGICQEARNERGYECLCPAEYTGQHCNRTGQACRPGLCGPGRCSDTADGYKCACPVAYTGKNCEQNQTIEYPAFTGSAYLAIKLPGNSRRLFRMSMKIKATPPVIDGIIMYCKAKSGGFIALTVRNAKLEFRFDLGDGNPVILTSNKTIDVNEWTDVNIYRIDRNVSMTINMIDSYEQKLTTSKGEMILDTPMFVGGVDESVTLDNNTGVTGGFSGCIKDVRVHDGKELDIVNSSIQSANVRECPNDVRGDIPEVYSVCGQCLNGGGCTSADATACSCPSGFSGTYCENRTPYRQPTSDPCAARPCINGGFCKIDLSAKMNYACDCTLGWEGTNCQISLNLGQSVAFNGNGYLELPGNMINYENLDTYPAIMAFAISTESDGVIMYHREARAPARRGDYILIRIEHGIVVMEWKMASGLSELRIENVHVTDGERHQIIAKLQGDGQFYLSVDRTSKTGTANGYSDIMNADSNVYIGGIPEHFNYMKYPGLSGCVQQVELMNIGRSIDLGRMAIAGRNTRHCRE